MAVIGEQTAPGVYASGNYFKIIKQELMCSLKEKDPYVLIHLGFYASAWARDQPDVQPIWIHPIKKTIADLVAEGKPDPRIALYNIVMEDPLFAGTNAVSDTPADQPGDVIQPETDNA